MIRGDSILNTASTAAVALLSVTATHQSSRTAPGQTRRGGRARAGRVGDQASGGVVFPSIWRSSAPTFQLSGWISRNRLVHSRASALSLHCMMA